MKNLSKRQLKQLYLTERLNPYEIGERLNCDHKTVRRYLKLHEIPLRSASEYNFLSKASHYTPIKEKIFSDLSIAAHIAYLCEGWHTKKSSCFYFCNTDANLINLEIKLLTDIYKVSNVSIQIVAKSSDDIDNLLTLYPKAKFLADEFRKTPIIRLRSGGKVLVRDVVQNAYIILSSLS